MVPKTSVSETNRDPPRKPLRSPRRPASIPVSKSESENLTGPASSETLRAWAPHTRAACSSATPASRTGDQNLDLQEDALRKAGCESSSPTSPAVPRTNAPDWPRRSPSSVPGDTLVVWKLDRLGRSLKHLIETVTALQTRKIGFRSLQESIDTTTSGGKLIFHVFGALAEFERDLIREVRHRFLRPGLLAARCPARTEDRHYARVRRARFSGA